VLEPRWLHREISMHAIRIHSGVDVVEITISEYQVNGAGIISPTRSARSSSARSRSISEARDDPNILGMESANIEGGRLGESSSWLVARNSSSTRSEERRRQDSLNRVHTPPQDRSHTYFMKRIHVIVQTKPADMPRSVRNQDETEMMANAMPQIRLLNRPPPVPG
jgi:hypothetical protein